MSQDPDVERIARRHARLTQDGFAELEYLIPASAETDDEALIDEVPD